MSKKHRKRKNKGLEEKIKHGEKRGKVPRTSTNHKESHRLSPFISCQHHPLSSQDRGLAGGVVAIAAFGKVCRKRMIREEERTNERERRFLGP